MAYQYSKAWRKLHPEKWRRLRKENYARGRINCYRRRAPWSNEEDLRITAPDRPSDRELALELGRSVQAIQVRRVLVRSNSEVPK